MYTMYRSLLARFVGSISRCEALELARELTQEEGNTYLRLERVIDEVTSFSDKILKYEVQDSEEDLSNLSKLLGELVLNLSEVVTKLDIELDDLYAVPMTDELTTEGRNLEEESSRLSKQLVDLVKDMSGDDSTRKLDLTADQSELLLDLLKELITIVDLSLTSKNIGKLIRSEVAIYISGVIDSLDD